MSFPGIALNPSENIFAILTLEDLPDEFDRYTIYHLRYPEAEFGPGLYYSPDEVVLIPILGVDSAGSDFFAPSENGFVDRADSTLAFVDGTRTFTITPSGVNPLGFTYFYQSIKYTVSSADSLVISDVEGLHYIYYDDTGLAETLTFTPSIISLYAFVFVVYWDATNSESVYKGDERHGNVMDSMTHTYNHLTFGTRYASGLAITNMDIDGSGNDATAAQFGVTGGVIFDEDIEFTITQGSPQTLAVPAEIPILYRDGASGLWRKVTATTYPITTTGTGRPAWNEFTGGVWQLTEVTANDFVLMHYFASPDIEEPIFGIVGQAEYATVALARAGAEVELTNLQVGPLDVLSPEYLPIATVIFETKTTYSNAVKSRTRTTDTGADYIDWRTQKSGVGSSASTGLSDVVDDLTPQLGGDLDVNGNDIVSTSNADINILPNGTGEVTMAGSLRTSDHTADDLISGAEVLDAEGNFQPVGVGLIIEDSDTYDTAGTLFPFLRTNANQCLEFNGAGVTNWSTLGSAGAGNLAIPIGTCWMGLVLGSGTLTIIGGSGITMRYFAGTASPGAPADVNVVIPQGGIFNLRKSDETVYDIWHN